LICEAEKIKFALVNIAFLHFVCFVNENNGRDRERRALKGGGTRVMLDKWDGLDFSDSLDRPLGGQTTWEWSKQAQSLDKKPWCDKMRGFLLTINFERILFLFLCPRISFFNPQGSSPPRGT
jgi:hypothetical protein